MITDIIVHLIADEVEAIEGYNKAIKEIKCDEVVKKLEEIRDDEIEHINELSKILNKENK